MPLTVVNGRGIVPCIIIKQYIPCLIAGLYIRHKSLLHMFVACFDNYADNVINDQFVYPIYYLQLRRRARRRIGLSRDLIYRYWWCYMKL